MNGKVDLGNGSGLCGACHGTGASPWPTTAAHPAHQNPTLTEPLACSSCHVVPATILDPGPSRRYRARHLLRARDGARVGPGLERRARARTSPATARTSPDPAAVPAWDDTSGAQAQCGACHGIPPSQEHTPSASCNRSDCHGSEVTLDANGAPHISAAGMALHIDGIIESGR